MSAAEALREFISERLSAAAAEIATVFERAVVRYEEQLERQRGLLELTGKKQQKKLHGAETREHRVCAEDAFCDKEDPEAPQCKEEKEELCVTQPELKRESGPFVETLADAESDDERDSEELLSHRSVRAFVNVQLSAAAGDIFSMVEQTVVQQEEQRLRGAVCKEEPLCHQEANSCLDHGNPEPPHWKEEKEEPEVKQESGVFMEPPADGGSDFSEADVKELLPHSAVTEFSSSQLTVMADDDGKLAELKPFILKVEEGNDSRHQQLSNIWQPQIKLLRTDCREQQACNEEQLSQEWTADLRQEEPAPLPPIQEVQEELGPTLEEGVHLLLMQETEGRPEVPVCFESHHSEAGPGGVVPLFGYSAGDVNSSDPLKCDVCGKTFKSVAIRKKHCKIHSGEKPYSCSECSKSFNRKGTLTIHQRTHTGEKPYSCPECSKSFTQRSTLTTHQKTHSGEKPYFCTECGKSFNMQGSLVVHMRTHTGEKPYPCPECGKSFRQQSSFVIHRRTHTGEKPYSCPDCSKSFRHLSSFFTHRRTHTGEKPYACSECGKGFSGHSHWKLHMRSHSGEKPYSCVKCPKRFALRRSFRNHMKKHTD